MKAAKKEFGKAYLDLNPKLDALIKELVTEAGETWVKPQEEFNADIREECTSGIHLFITRKEAEDY